MHLQSKKNQGKALVKKFQPEVQCSPRRLRRSTKVARVVLRFCLFSIIVITKITVIIIATICCLLCLACCGSRGCRVRHDWATELNWCMKSVLMLFLLDRWRNRRLANSSTYPKWILNYQVISSHIFFFTFVLILFLAFSKKRVRSRDVIFSVPVANYWLK